MNEVTPEQRALEVESNQLGIERYRSAAGQMMKDGRLSGTKPGRILMAVEVSNLEVAIQAWIDAKRENTSVEVLRFMGHLKVSALAALTAQVMMDSATKGLIRSTTICTIANTIRDDGILTSMRTQHKPLYERVRSYKTSRTNEVKLAKKWASRSMWSFEEELRPEQIRSGLVLYSLALEATSVFRQVTTKSGKRNVTVLTLTPEALEWINQSHDEHEIMQPVYQPMVQQPLDWSPTQRGGYLTDAARRRPMCRLQRRSHGKALEAAEMPEVYRAVNLAQSTAWRVNPDVMEVMSEMWDSGNGIADMPSQYEPEFPSRPFEPDKDAEGPEVEEAREVLHAWKKNVAIALDSFQNEGSSRLRHARCLAIARKFAGKKIYYPHFIDWRCRLYPVPQYLNHQGADLARGLLQFDSPSFAAHGSPEAAHYLAFGQGLWKGDIPTGLPEAVAQDPLDCTGWKDADKPWQFLAWCLEAGPWLGDESSPVRQPIQADGTNNGLQIYSLLTRNEKMARSTNVSEGDKEDIYQDVADVVWNQVLIDPSEMAATWRAFLPEGLDREVVKVPVMAAPYGIRKHSAMAGLRRWVLERQKELNIAPWGHSTFKPVCWLADKIWDEIGSHIGPAREVMDWMREVSHNVDAKISWTTPVGFRVSQEYLMRTKKKLKVAVNDSMKYVRYRGYAPGVSRARMADGFAPNYIHSLDSAALMRTMGQCADQGVKSFSMIHDSYGCPVGDTETMARTLRSVFSKMFAGNLLDDLRQELIMASPGKDIPPLPERGSLSADAVLTSKYFFS
jgi:DNA-directed RNA polymerase